MNRYSDFKKLNKNAIKSMIISELIGIFIIIGISTVIRVILFKFILNDTITFWINVIYILIIVICILSFILTPTVGYNRIRYRINDESIEYRSGIIFINHSIVPIRRMQQVDIEEGPINRLFKLAEIVLVTAGGNLRIRYIEKEEAEKIVDDLKGLINKFAKEKRESEEVEANG